MDANTLVTLFNYGMTLRETIIAEMEYCAEHVVLIDSYVFTPSTYADCDMDGESNMGWEA